MREESSFVLGLLLGFVLMGLQNASAQFSYDSDGSACSTPDKLTGTCINLMKCKPLFELLQQKPLLPSSITLLRQSQCGFEGSTPRVCCRVDSQTNDLEPPDVTRHPNSRLLDHKNCGPINRDKILGGTRAGLFEFPWMALLAYRSSSRVPEFRCGGTVINKRYILTAAHCVTNLQSNLNLMGVRVGEYDTSKERDCITLGTFEEYCAEMYQDFSIEQVIPHPKYARNKVQNDIALIRVDRDIDFRPDNSKPICLPIGSAGNLTKNKMVVTGWGLYENYSQSPIMLKVTLPRVPQEECKRTYARRAEIWHKQLCMGGEQGRDSCSGDSGGPLQAPTANYSGSPRFVQYGIVSFGLRNCGTEGFPGVYTRVDFYMDWLLDNLRD